MELCRKLKEFFLKYKICRQLSEFLLNPKCALVLVLTVVIPVLLFLGIFYLPIPILTEATYYPLLLSDGYVAQFPYSFEDDSPSLQWAIRQVFDQPFNFYYEVCFTNTEKFDSYKVITLTSSNSNITFGVNVSERECINLLKDQEYLVTLRTFTKVKPTWNGYNLGYGVELQPERWSLLAKFILFMLLWWEGYNMIKDIKTEICGKCQSSDSKN